MLTALRRARLEHRDEDGFTIIEVMMCTALLLVVLAMVFGALVSLTRSEDRAQRLVSNEQNVRFEVNQLAREIRASNHLIPLPNATSASDYENQIQMLLGPEGGTQTVVRWTYDTTAKKLVRQQMSSTLATATVLNQSYYLASVRNVESGTPLFSYYGQSGVDLIAQTLANGGDKDDAAYCAVRVRIHVASDSNPGPLPFTQTQDVEVRNRLPGNVECG